jgi:glutamate carboxypeptidase
LMNPYSPYLDWIDTQRPAMCRMVADLAAINTASHNVAGIEQCLDMAQSQFSILQGEAERVHSEVISYDDKPLGSMLHIVKRPQALLRILLAIHIDTVYAQDHSFPLVKQADDRALQGPGVADAKGGVVVMLKALEALERSPWAENIGWEVILNSDEEIGSPGSSALLNEAARRNHLGMLFEPALLDGALVAARKGSGNFTAQVTGRAAHAGRDPHSGANAIHALAEFITAIAALDGFQSGITTNVGKIAGGSVPNVVPDHASCIFNVRVKSVEQQRLMENQLEQLVAQFNQRQGIKLELMGGFGAPPKPVDVRMRQLLDLVSACGADLDMKIHWRDGGGVCDGNRLAAAGLTNVDTLGVVGGALHSDQEFVILDSLPQRAKLSALLLMKLAAGHLVWRP